MPSFIEIVTISISVLSLFMVYLGFRDKRSDKTDKELSERVKSQMLVDSANVKASILAEAVNGRILEIRDIQDKMHECVNKSNILEERVNSLIKLSDRMAEKLDKMHDYLIENKNDDNCDN